MWDELSEDAFCEWKMVGDVQKLKTQSTYKSG